MADDYMRQVAQAYYGMPNAPVMDAPPVQGDPAAMAAPTWNMVSGAPDGGGAPPMSSAAPPAPLMSQAPPTPMVSAPPPAPLVSQAPPPAPAPPAPEPKMVPVSAGLAPDRFSLKALIKAKEEADRIPIYGPVDPGPGLRAAPPPPAPDASRDVMGSVSSTPLSGVMIGGGGPVQSVEKDMLGPKAHGLIEHGFNAEASGVDKVAELQQAQAAREAEAMQARANQLQGEQDAMERARAQRADELARMHAEMKADADQVANQHIDNDAIYGKNGINKGMAMVGIALGGFIQGMRGGPNVAMDAINTQIERSVAAQKFANDAKLKSFDAKQSAYKMALEKYGQEDVAQNMARIYMLDKYAAETGKMAAASKGVDAQGVNAKIQGDIQKQKDMLAAQNLKLMQVGGGGGKVFIKELGIAVTPEQYNALVIDRYKAERGAGLDMLKDSNKAKAEGGKGDEARLVDVGGGRTIKARSVEEAIKLDADRRNLEEQQNKIMSVREAAKQVGGLDKLASKIGWDTAAFAKLSTAQKELALSKAKEGGGTVTDSDMKNAVGTVGDQTKVLGSAGEQARLDALQASVDKKKELLDRGRDITTRAPPAVKKGW